MGDLFNTDSNGAVFSSDVANTTGIGQRRQSNGIGESRQPYKASENGNWENFPTKSPICGGNDGIPNKLDGITFSKWRNESIKGYGNAIVPQVVYEIFKVIENLTQITHENRQ